MARPTSPWVKPVKRKKINVCLVGSITFNPLSFQIVSFLTGILLKETESTLLKI